MAKTIKKTKTAKAAGDDGKFFATQRDGAEYAGVSERQFQRWVKDGHIAKTKLGYRKDQIDEYNALKIAGANTVKERLLEGTAREKEAKAELAEMKVAIQKGELVYKKEIEAEQVEKILTIRRMFSQIGKKLCRQLAVVKDPIKIQEMIDDEYNCVMNYLADNQEIQK